jgi:16S rRNA (uracil1498-N3)-methyltransferase
MTVFYAPEVAFNNVLPKEESQHAIKVLRLKKGDKIVIVDGKGNGYLAEILFPDSNHCEFEILETLPDEGNIDYHLHIAIAPTKNVERFEWFVEKATEIGIHEITPIICKFSERKMIKPERLEKIVISACKQSMRAQFPVVHSLCSFQEVLTTYSAQQKFIAHCYTDQIMKEFDCVRKRNFLKNLIEPSTKIFILIGPEGDFSIDEVKTAIEKGFDPVSLGVGRLRTETAGIVACTTVALINQ